MITPPTTGSIRTRLLAPLNLAAYITWAAVLIEVASRPFAVPTGIVCMTLFLGGFVWGALQRPTTPHAALPIGIWLGFGVMIAAFIALLWAGPAGSTPVLLIIVAVVAALNLATLWLVTAMVTLNVVMFLIFVFRWQVPNPVQLLLVMSGFQLFALITVDAQRRATVAAEQLRRVNAALITTRTLLAEGVREAERLRLSRELHDVSGHKLTALKLHLMALARDPGPDTRDNITRAAELAGALLADIRAVVSQLRRHDGIAIGELLDALARDWPSPTVLLAVDAGVRVDNIEQAEALLRIAQEGLTNAARHANARCVWIELHATSTGFRLQIDDDGRCALPIAPGVGMTGMSERLAALSGSLTIDQSPRGGLRLTAQLPRGAVVS